jgi:hypothetical protein
MAINFLDLPREIRDQIYILVLVPPNGIKAYRGMRRRTNIFYQYNSTIDKLSISLLMTSHQIRHEALTIFNTNTLHITSLEDIFYQPRIARGIGSL